VSERLSRRYPVKKLTDVDYADDLALTDTVEMRHLFYII